MDPISKKKLSRKKHSSLLRSGNIDAEEKKFYDIVHSERSSLQEKKFQKKTL